MHVSSACFVHVAKLLKLALIYPRGWHTIFRISDEAFVAERLNFRTRFLQKCLPRKSLLMTGAQLPLANAGTTPEDL